MEFHRGDYISIYFPKIHLGTHIKEINDQQAKLVGDPRRKLQKFFAGDDVKQEGLDLVDNDADEWDQFKENEIKHNVVTTFDPSKYTTELNMKALTREQLELGAKIAESIENAPAQNYHMREDRGQLKHANFEEEEEDEEKRYSAVIGTGNYKDDKIKSNTIIRRAPASASQQNGSAPQTFKKKYEKGKEMKMVKKSDKNKNDASPENSQIAGLPTFTNTKKVKDAEAKNTELTKSIKNELGINLLSGFSNETPTKNTDDMKNHEKSKDSAEKSLSENEKSPSSLGLENLKKQAENNAALNLQAKAYVPKNKEKPKTEDTKHIENEQNQPPKGALKVTAKAFIPKTEQQKIAQNTPATMPAPSHETKIKLSAEVKEFKPKSQTTVQASSGIKISWMTKPLVSSAFSSNLRAAYKQFDKKKALGAVMPIIAKESWIISDTITIKENKAPQPAGYASTQNVPATMLPNTTMPPMAQPPYYYNNYYMPYVDPNQFYGYYNPQMENYNLQNPYSYGNTQMNGMPQMNPVQGNGYAPKK